MRHRVVGKKLNRDKDHRASLLKNLASALILNGRIETSVVKAKFVKPFVEKLIKKGVFIGSRSVIKNNINIGEGSVVGAHLYINKNLKNNSFIKFENK